ncbi:MAG: hypothetical protein ACT4OO_00185 [Nitrospiraceae bacterium]
MRTNAVAFATFCAVVCLMPGCGSGPQPGVAGIYNTWDDVVNRQIGAKTQELYYELGPPNLHPHALEHGMTEMVWDMTIDRMPGQADNYNTLPLYGGNACRLVFIADKDEIVQSGRRIGCD